MESKNLSGEKGYEAFIVEGTLLKRYNGNDDYVRLPGFIYIIGCGAFEGNNRVKIINLSSNVKEIGDFAFKNCQSLSEIIFNGTKERWIEIIKGEKWFEGTGEFVISCKDGEITKQEEIESDPKTDPVISELLDKVRREGKVAAIKQKEIQEKRDKEQRKIKALLEGENEISDDELCYKALRYFIKNGSATTLTVASEFKINYLRASILIKWMEANKYIKPTMTGFSFAPYKVLITREEFKKIYADIDDVDEEDSIEQRKSKISLPENYNKTDAATDLATVISRIAEKKKNEKVTLKDLPSRSLWEDSEEFENALTKRIRGIALSDLKMTRGAAIKKAETYLEAVRDTHDGAMMQIYERLVYELKRMSDRDYNYFRKLLRGEH